MNLNADEIFSRDKTITVSTENDLKQATMCAHKDGYLNDLVVIKVLLINVKLPRHFFQSNHRQRSPSPNQTIVFTKHSFLPYKMWNLSLLQWLYSENGRGSLESDSVKIVMSKS